VKENLSGRLSSIVKRLARWFAYLCFLTVVTGGLAEIIGRQFWISDGSSLYWRKYELFVFDPELNYTLKSGFAIDGAQNRLYPGVGIRINDLGLRTAKLDDRPKVLVLGDSVAFGYGVSSEQMMTARMEILLGGKYQVVNAGIPGFNFEQIGIMAKRLVTRVRPIAVVVVLNANDLESRYYITHGGATVARFRAYPWEENLKEEAPVSPEIYDRWILAAGVKRIKVNDFPRSAERLEKNTQSVLEAERRILDYHHADGREIQVRIQQAIESTRRLREDMSARGIKVVFAFFPWRLTVVDAVQEDKIVHRWISSVPVGSSIRAVDLLPILRGAQKIRPQFLVADGHPNEHGHETIARALVAALRDQELSSFRGLGSNQIRDEFRPQQTTGDPDERLREVGVDAPVAHFVGVGQRATQNSALDAHVVDFACLLARACTLRCRASSHDKSVARKPRTGIARGTRSS